MGMWWLLFLQMFLLMFYYVTKNYLDTINLVFSVQNSDTQNFLSTQSFKTVVYSKTHSHSCISMDGDGLDTPLSVSILNMGWLCSPRTVQQIH